MGIFYTNITLKGARQQEVVDYLKRAQCQAYVSPATNDCIVVFDRVSDEDSVALRKLASNLSKEFQCPALAALVHDGDLFLYWLYKAGRLVDEYDSMPTYFQTDAEAAPPKGGNPEALCEAFRAQHALSDLQAIFKRATKAVLDDDWSEEHLIGDEIHDVIAQALGLPLFVVDTGFYSIQNDSLPEDLTKESLIYLFSAPP
jgi:hypothetical protein